MKNLRDLDGMVQWVNYFNNGYHKAGFACAVLLILVTGCAPEANAAFNNGMDAEGNKPAAPEVAPGIAPTTVLDAGAIAHEATKQLFAKPSVEPTDIPPTLEPTELPRLLAEQFELDPERTYERRTVTGTDGAEHDALVDTYNQSPKVIFADGGAVKLDESDPAQRELMWGHLVPEGEEYISRNGKAWDNPELGTRAWDMNQVRLLGETGEEIVSFGGKDVRAVKLKAGLRDDEGRLHVLWLVYDSPDVGPAHGAYFTCYTEEYKGMAVPVVPLLDLLPRLLPGEKNLITVYLVTGRVKVPSFHPAKSDEYPENNNMQKIFATTMMNGHPEYGLTKEEFDWLAGGVWPDREVTLPLPYGLYIYRDVWSDCPQR